MIMGALLRTAAVSALCAVWALAAQAQSYPSKPITLIVPFPPGGTSDFSGRLIAQELSKQIGQPVVVENKGGANGNIGSAQAARAPADGYTLVLSGVGSHAINAAIYKDMPYDPVKDFAHITMIASGPNAIAAHPDFPGKSLKEMIDLARANPDKYHYASSGNGASNHMTMELLKQRAGIKIVHVPYRGGGPALNDVLAGQVPLIVQNADALLQHGQSGKLRILATTGAERGAMFPDTPTVAEAGFPGFSAVSWTGISAPARTPAAIIARLHAEIAKAIHGPAATERLVAIGLKPSGNSPEEFTQFVTAEVAQWDKVAKSANITVD
jgi:tripartite-type tricarboxylate transporter receptor subunit TctC